MNFFVFVLLAFSIMLACVALRINPIRTFQKIANTPDPTREAEWDELAQRLSEKYN